MGAERFIRGIATADLHLGIDNVGGVNQYGLPARVDDFFGALDSICMIALGMGGGRPKADLLVIAGDLTRHRNPPQRIMAPLLYRLREMSNRGITVVLVRGNHDGDSGGGQSNLLDSAEMVGMSKDAPIVTFNEPASTTLEVGPPPGKKVRIIGVPWPRLGRADNRPLDEVTMAADEAVRQTIAKAAALGQGYGEPMLMVGHLAVAGADRASDAWMTLGWEPLVRPVDFPGHVDLTVLGHYHKPGLVKATRTPVVYCGSPITIDFGEEGQEKVCWSFALDPSQPEGKRCVELTPIPLPGRPFRTLELDMADFIAPEAVTAAAVDAIHQAGSLADAVVRVRVKCRAAAQAGALKLGAIDAALRQDGAWYVAGITVEAPRAERRWAGGEGLTARPPDELLREYLERTEPDEARRARLFGLAMGLRADNA